VAGCGFYPTRKFFLSKNSPRNNQLFCNLIIRFKLVVFKTELSRQDNCGEL